MSEAEGRSVVVNLPLFQPPFSLAFPEDAPEPDPVLDFKLRASYREGTSWREIRSDGGLRCDLTEDELLSIAGGREYRIGLRYGRNHVPGTARTLDLRDRGEPRAPEGNQSAPRAPAVVPTATLDPGTNAIREFFMHSAEQAREDSRRLVETVAAMMGATAGGNRGGVDRAEVDRLHRELDRLTARADKLVDENRDLAAKNAELRMRIHLTETMSRAGAGSPGWRILDKLVDKAGGDVLKALGSLSGIGGGGNGGLDLTKLPPDVRDFVGGLMSGGLPSGGGNGAA